MNFDPYIPPSYADRLRSASRGRRLALVALAVIVTLAAAIVAAVVLLDYPADDLLRLSGVLLVSGTVSLVIGGILLWLLGEQHGRRIAARLITAHVIGMLVVVVIVGVSALVLFDSEHDFEILGLLLAYAVAMAAIYSAFVSGWFTSSVGNLAAASRRLAEGDLSIRLPDRGEQEFADLGGAMNTLAGRLQFAYQRQRSLEESQRYLLAAVIAEMQPHLAAIDRGLESFARGDVADDSSIRRLSSSMRRELEGQQKILVELELLAQIEAGRSAGDTEPVNLSAMILSVCDKLIPQATAIGVSLLPRVRFATGHVYADPGQLMMTLEELIDAAVRQEASGGSVMVEMIDLGSDAQVNIASSGPTYGVNSPVRTVGLVIARRLIEINGGRVWTAQPLTGGAVTSFTLPVVQEVERV
ncbi:MAG: HAMP domain-containing protein [Thermomicrobiales bacterium]